MPKYFYPLVENPYRSKDINRAIKVLKSNKLTSGPISKNFQDFFTRKLRSNNSLMVNSGSSANLLALQCLINPYRKKRLVKGDEVLIPALCWSTSLWPIIQSMDKLLKHYSLNYSKLLKHFLTIHYFFYLKNHLDAS